MEEEVWREKKMDGRTHGRTARRTDEWKERKMDGGIEGEENGWKESRRGRRMGKRGRSMEGDEDGRMNGRRGRRTKEYKNRKMDGKMEEEYEGCRKGR